MLMPGLGERSIPRRARVMLSVALSIIVYMNVRSELPAIPQSVPMLFFLLARELLIGIMIATVARIILGAIHTTGAIIAMLTGLAAAQSFDPNQGSQSAMVSTFLTLVAVTMIMVTDTHHLMILGMQQSYVTFPVGTAVPFADLAGIAAHYVASSFRFAVQIASPFIVYSLIFNTSLGLIARMVPQFQVFFVAMPVNILLGLALLMLLLGTMMSMFMAHFRTYLLQFMG